MQRALRPEENRSHLDSGAVSEAAVKAAASHWFYEHDISWMHELLTAGITLYGSSGRLVSTLRPLLQAQPELSAEDAALKLKEAGHADEGTLLESLIEKSLEISQLTFKESLDKLRLIQAAKEITNRAQYALQGEYASIEAFFADVEKLREAMPQKAGFTVHFFGNPEKEPVIEPTKAFVADLLFPGYTVASGPWKKSNKTRLFLTLCFAIHTGTSVFGRDVRKARCAWVQRDMRIEDFIEYSRKIRQGMGFPTTEVPFVADPLDLTQPEDQARLVAVSKHLGTEVLFLDSSRAVASVEENSSDSVRPFIRGFICDVLRDRLGLSVVLIGHPSKHQPGMRGSGDWEAGADSILRFEPQGNPVTTHVSVTGEGRHPPVEFTFAVDDLTPFNGGWVVREFSHEERGCLPQEEASQSTENKIRRWWGTNPGAHAQTAILRGAGVRDKDGRKALVNLQGRGLVKGNPGPRGAKLWSLSDPVPLTPSGPNIGTGTADGVKDDGPVSTPSTSSGTSRTPDDLEHSNALTGSIAGPPKGQQDLNPNAGEVPANEAEECQRYPADPPEVEKTNGFEEDPDPGWIQDPEELR